MAGQCDTGSLGGGVGERGEELAHVAAAPQVGAERYLFARLGGVEREDVGDDPAGQLLLAADHRVEPVAARQGPVASALSHRGHAARGDPQAAGGREVGLVALGRGPGGVLAEGQDAAGDGEYEEQYGPGGAAGAPGELPAEEGRGQAPAARGQASSGARGERQQPQDEQRASAQGEGRGGDQDGVHAESAAEAGGGRRGVGTAVLRELLVAEDGEGHHGQVQAGTGGSGHHRLAAAGPAQYGGRGAAQDGGQGREQDAGQGAAGRDGPDQPGVRDLQADPLQRSEPAEQAQQGRGQQRSQDGGGQGEQQGLGGAQGAEPAAGGAAGGEQDALRLLADGDDVGDEEQCGGGEDGELEGAHHQGRAGDAQAGFQLGEDLRQLGGGPEGGAALEGGRGGFRGAPDRLGLGAAEGGEVRSEQREAVVLQECARREGAVVHQERTVGGEGAGLDLAAAERVEPPVPGVRVGGPVHAGDEHGERGAAEAVVEADRCGQGGLGEAEPGEGGARYGDLYGCRGAGRGGGDGDGRGPLAGEQVYAFPGEGGEEGQVGVLARGGGAGESVRTAAGHALGGHGEPSEHLVRVGPDGRVVLGAGFRGVAAGDHDGGPGLFRAGEGPPQPLLPHAAGESRQRGQSGRCDQYGEQHGDGERPSPAQPAHDEAEHVLSSSPVRTPGTG